MRDADFRRSQEEGLRLPHSAPINELVDQLREEGRGWVPYVAPIYGGVDAEMLSVLRDPGPMTHSEKKGSGFLCLENDDAAAERFATLLEEAGLTPDRMVPWNAYPWYINRKPNAVEISAGIDPLRRLLKLLPRLRVVMLNGGEAQSLWRKFIAAYPSVGVRYAVLPTYHTSRQAFIGTRERWRGAHGRPSAEVRDGGASIRLVSARRSARRPELPKCRGLQPLSWHLHRVTMPLRRQQGGTQNEAKLVALGRRSRGERPCRLSGCIVILRPAHSRNFAGLGR